MAVRTVGLSGVARQATGYDRAQIKYVQNGQVWTAIKLSPEEFDESHRKALLTAHFTPSRELVFSTPGWRSCWLGAGEEKVVYLVIDVQDRAFALEVLAKGTYLAGRLAEGHYFADMQLPLLTNVRWDDRSLFGHIFSGEVKAREFIYGDTLSGPGLRNPAIRTIAFGFGLLGRLSKSWAAFVVAPRYLTIRKIYRDAHEANVMLEILPLHNPEKKSHYLLPIPWLEEDGKLRFRFFRLTPIDVRAR